MGARRIKQEKLRTMAKTIVVLKREGHPPKPESFSFFFFFKRKPEFFSYSSSSLLCCFFAFPRSLLM
jgi:hypothetical protein